MVAATSDIADSKPLKQALRDYFPRGRTGNPVHISTAFRWNQIGVGPHKVKLEFTRVGGAIYVTREAATRFLAALNENRDQSPAPSLTAGQRQRQSAAAREVLKSEFGI